MDCTNTDVFSPIRNFDEKKINRQSDGFSEFLKGPDVFQKKSMNSKTLENVDKNTTITNISNMKSSKTPQKRTVKYDVFSPIRNFDEEKINRQSDGISEFLKGPDIFKKKSVNSETLENVDENTPVNNILNIKSNKSHQKKTSKCEISKKELASSTSMHDSGSRISPEKSTSLKKDKSKNISVASKKNDKLRTNQQSGTDCNNKKKTDSHTAKKKSVNLLKSSLHSGAAAVPKASGSKERKKADEPSSVNQHSQTFRMKGDLASKASGSKVIKKADEPSSMTQPQMKGDLVSKASGSKEIKKAGEPSSVNQRNPLSQMKSGLLEKIINDAVKSQVDVIQQSLWAHQLNLLKAIYNIQVEMEQSRAENTNMFKIIEQLLEENSLLRTALLAQQ